ncbi:MAG: hypothetical protein N4A41_08305 [Crocinitomicaceae bacterium]|jgi:hypothetical protein|nr:hypothetical protein [Crocinitomicaceae bacterium]
MELKTIQTNGLQTIDWFRDTVVDWNSAGNQYFEDGTVKQLGKYNFGFKCDGSITSESGEYVFIYQKLGTKGLLLRNGQVYREINRSYYQSSAYEFPAAFIEHNNRIYLIHCPNGYNQIDFEDAETGKVVTNISGRSPSDFFHSRFEVSPDHKSFVSKGWFWHPYDGVKLFSVDECFKNPLSLDQGHEIPNSTTEICSASFINSDQLIVCSSTEERLDDENVEPIPEGHMAIWNIKTDEISGSVKIQGPYGNLYSIDQNDCWDLFKYPKIIEISTGRIIDKIENLYSGEQNSSIIHHLKMTPKIAYNRNTKKIAIAGDSSITILSR